MGQTKILKILSVVVLNKKILKLILRLLTIALHHATPWNISYHFKSTLYQFKLSTNWFNTTIADLPCKKLIISLKNKI